MIICQKPFLEILINIAIPIITLFIGMLFIPIAESFKEKYRIKKLKQFIIITLQQIYEEVEIQKKNIKAKTEELENFNYFNIIPIKSPQSAIRGIQSINTADLYKALVDKKKGCEAKIINDYKEIVKTVDYYSEIFPLTFKTCQKAVTDINLFNSDWNQSQMQFQQLINDFTSESIIKGIEPLKDDFLSQVINNKKEMQKKYGDEYPNIEVSYLEHVRPIIEICKRFIGDKRAVILFHESQKSKLAYEQLKAVRNRINKYLEKVYEGIEASNSSFTNVISNLK